MPGHVIRSFVGNGCGPVPLGDGQGPERCDGSCSCHHVKGILPDPITYVAGPKPLIRLTSP